MSGLAFAEIGEAGRPVVLVHGWCCRRRHMWGLAEALAAEHRVFAVDLPGHGETPLAGRTTGFGDFAWALAEFLAEHNLEEVVLVGHSMGGVLAILTAGQAGGRVAGVVNLDGALPLAPEARAAYPELLQELSSRDYRSVIEPFLRRTFFLPTEAGPMMEAILADMTAASPEIAVALLGQFPTLDAAAILARCEVPLLYIGAARPRFGEAEIRALRPDVQLARVECGHFVQIYALPQVAEVIRYFARSLPEERKNRLGAASAPA